MSQDDKIGMVITAMYNLFLHREPERDGFEHHYKKILSTEKKGYYLKSFFNCPERKNLLATKPHSKPIRPVMLYTDILQFAIECEESDEHISRIKVEYALSLEDYHKGLKIIVDEGEDLQLEYRIRLINQLGSYDLITQEYVFLESVAKFGWGALSSHCFLSINMPQWIQHPDNSAEENRDIVCAQRGILQNSLSFLADSLSAFLINNCGSLADDRIMELFEAIVSIKGLTSTQKQICHDIVLNILTYNPAEKFYPCINETRRLTFISGFFHSGSSAIYDYLRGNHFFCDCFASEFFPQKNEHEISFISNSYGIVDLYFSMFSSENILRRNLIKFFLFHMLAWHVPHNGFSFNTRVNFSVPQAFYNSYTEYRNYLFTISIWIRDVLNIFKKQHKDYYQVLFQRFIFDLIDLLHGKKQTYKNFILNNAIMLPCVKKVLQIFPSGTTYIAIFRDPRDHYIVCLEHNFLKDTAEYIAYMKTTLADLAQVNVEHSNKYRIIPVSYERFVQNEEYRFQLLEKLGCTEKFESPYFDPSFSITRIGKYKTYEDQAAIRQVEEAFPELMSGEYFLQFKNRI